MVLCEHGHCRAVAKCFPLFLPLCQWQDSQASPRGGGRQPNCAPRFLKCSHFFCHAAIVRKVMLGCSQCLSATVALVFRRNVSNTRTQNTHKTWLGHVLGRIANTQKICRNTEKLDTRQILLQAADKVSVRTLISFHCGHQPHTS